MINDIFSKAVARFICAKGYDKHYGRCLLAELKSRKIAKGGYEDTEEFLNWSNSFKQYRYNIHVKSKLLKK